MSLPTQLERRYINDEIEQAYIATSQTATTLKSKIVNHKGNYHSARRGFFDAFAYLITLTASLKELRDANPDTDAGKKLREILRRVDEYQYSEVAECSDDRAKQLCIADMKLFDEYKAQLFRVGIIALPTKKGG